MPLPNDPTVWPGPKRISLSKCDAWFHDLPDELLVQTMLSDHLLRMYDNPSFFPGKNGMCNPLQGRNVGQDDVLPSTVAMASYSRQHLKSVAQLSSKGLLGSLRLRNNKWAFFTGLELLISMGWSGCISLPRSNELSCHVVGNCIAEGHALQPLFAAVVLCLGTCGLHVRFPFHHVIKFWESQRARATDCSITFSEDRIVVHRPLAVTRPVFNGLHSIWVFVLVAADCIRVACPVSTKLDDLKALVSQVSSVHICGFEDERGALPEVWIAARTCTIKAICSVWTSLAFAITSMRLRHVTDLPRMMPTAFQPKRATMQVEIRILRMGYSGSLSLSAPQMMPDIAFRLMVG